MAMRKMLGDDTQNTVSDGQEAWAEPVSEPAPQDAPVSPAAEKLVMESIAAAGETDERYAHMFADWDLLPPQVLIRRVKRH